MSPKPKVLLPHRIEFCGQLGNLLPCLITLGSQSGNLTARIGGALDLLLDLLLGLGNWGVLLVQGEGRVETISTT